VPDDELYTTDDNYSEEEKSEPSASVIFMEMMRREAAKSSPPAEMPYNTPHSPYSQTAQDTLDLSDEAASGQAPLELDTAMQEQRIRRVKRRKARRRNQTVGMVGGFLRTTLVVLISAGIMATIFSFWTDPRYINSEVRSNLQVALATNQVTLQPTGLPTPNWLRRIGIVSGHRGPENDPGAVCPDGLQEREINFNVAQLVVRNLRGLGYSVDLLDEFDPRLNNYQAAALVSLHANTCQEWPGGEIVSGYLVAKAAARPEGGEDTQLAECVATHYAPASGLERRFNLTEDMTNYHSFREIHPLTPAAIIELGFMLADRAVLTEQPDVLARAITDGILCFLEPGAATATQAPTP
jgi:N-acetylmuramoyl-L-alanine amidase